MQEMGLYYTSRFSEIMQLFLCYQPVEPCWLSFLSNHLHMEKSGPREVESASDVSPFTLLTNGV